jgi:hypothetical protein
MRNIQDESSMRNIQDESSILNIQDESSILNHQEKSSMRNIQDESSMLNIQDESRILDILRASLSPRSSCQEDSRPDTSQSLDGLLGECTHIDVQEEARTNRLAGGRPCRSSSLQEQLIAGRGSMLLPGARCRRDGPCGCAPPPAPAPPRTRPTA